MNFELILTVSTIISLMVGLFEWRIRSMYNELNEKIKDRDKVHAVIQENLKEDISRLEAKIDMVVTLLIQRPFNENKKDS